MTLQPETEDATFSLCQVVYQSKEDMVTVVAAGVTLQEALAAADHLKKGTVHEILLWIVRTQDIYHTTSHATYPTDKNTIFFNQILNDHTR